MRILYGVQGAGNGHISRCRTMAGALARQGVEVDFLFSGRAPEAYFDMTAFGAYRTANGLTFHSHDGRVDLGQTLCRSRPWQLVQDVRSLALAGYDRVITDFEPVTAWAARLQKVPSLGISHQACFAYPIPRRGEDWAARLIMRRYAPASQSIGLHWFHFGHPILPPIIDPLLPGTEDDSILVYLPFESLAAVRTVLARFGSQRFVCFHPEVRETHLEGNLLCQPLGREAFKRALGSCRGVISNAGFELASEALTLGKKLLLKPLLGQFEQASNAMTLEMLGLAEVMPLLEANRIRDWLEQDAVGAVSYPDVAAELASWLASGEREPLSWLVSRLWNRVCFPEATCDRLTELGLADNLKCGLLLNI